MLPAICSSCRASHGVCITKRCSTTTGCRLRCVRTDPYSQTNPSLPRRKPTIPVEHPEGVHLERPRGHQHLRSPPCATLLCQSIRKARNQMKHPTRVKTQKEDPKEHGVFRDIQSNPSGLHSGALTQKVVQGGRGQLTERTNHRATHEKVGVLQTKKTGSRTKRGG